MPGLEAGPGTRTLITLVGDGPVVGTKMLLTDDEQWGSVGTAALDARVTADARADLQTGWTGLRRYGLNGEPTKPRSR